MIIYFFDTISGYYLVLKLNKKRRVSKKKERRLINWSSLGVTVVWMSIGLVLFINLKRILTLLQRKANSPLEFHFLLTLVSVTRVVSKRWFVVFDLLHFFIFLLYDQAIGQFWILLPLNILWTLVILLGTTFLPQRRTWFYVILLVGIFWLSFLVFVLVTVSGSYIHPFGFIFVNS